MNKTSRKPAEIYVGERLIQGFSHRKSHSALYFKPNGAATYYQLNLIKVQNGLPIVGKIFKNSGLPEEYTVTNMELISHKTLKLFDLLDLY